MFKIIFCAARMPPAARARCGACRPPRSAGAWIPRVAER